MSVSLKKRRIDTHGPSGAAGGRMASMREPSGRRPSRIGFSSSIVLADVLRCVAERGDERLAALEARVVEVELALLLDVDLEAGR